MISIYMLFTALTTTALTQGSIICSFSEHTGVQQCSGPMGQLLIFHLSNTANPNIRLTKDNKYIILKVDKNQKVTLHEEYVNQSEFFTNGTLTLGNASKKHSGTYVLEEFGPTGNLVKKVNLHLQIQAPLSKPVVSQVCLSPEQMNISCSSEANEVEFMLTLDGVLLMQTREHSQYLGSWAPNMQPLADNKTEHEKPSVLNVTISLHGQLTGNLMCQVRNNVSRDDTILQLTACKASISHLKMAVRVGVITLLLLALCLGTGLVHMKTRLMTV